MRSTNFRTNYLEKIAGLSSAVDCSKLLDEQILSDTQSVDIAKLSQFAIRYELPNARRIGVWQLLLRMFVYIQKID